MTGFTENEYALSRLVGSALRKGMPESLFGFGGMRTVGPSVTYNAKGYMINGENGVVLGRKYSEARLRIIAMYAAWKEEAK